MAEERRFALALSCQNIKDNKITVVFILGLLLTSLLYVIYPTLTLTIAKQLNNDLGIFMNSIQNDTFEPIGFSPLRSPGFGSELVTQTCSEKNIFLSLGENVFLSVCNIINNTIETNSSNIIIDVRKFLGTVKTDLKPTLVGINLSLDQWNVLKENANAIDNIVIDISD